VSVAALASVIFGVLGYVAIGVALRLTGMLSPNDAKPLNTVLIYVALPALVFTTVQPAEVSLELAAIPALGWVIAVSGLALAWVCVRLLKLQGAAAGAFLLAAAFGNTGGTSATRWHPASSWGILAWCERSSMTSSGTPRRS